MKKREVLELIEERTKEGKETSFGTLVHELGLSPEAACSHLRRLWRERLIKSADWPSSYGRAAAFHPSIRELDFRITRRGLARLERWKGAGRAAPVVLMNRDRRCSSRSGTPSRWLSHGPGRMGSGVSLPPPSGA